MAGWKDQGGVPTWDAQTEGPSQIQPPPSAGGAEGGAGGASSMPGWGPVKISTSYNPGAGFTHPMLPGGGWADASAGANLGGPGGPMGGGAGKPFMEMAGGGLQDSGGGQIGGPQGPPPDGGPMPGLDGGGGISPDILQMILGGGQMEMGALGGGNPPPMSGGGGDPLVEQLLSRKQGQV